MLIPIILIIVLTIKGISIDKISTFLQYSYNIYVSAKYKLHKTTCLINNIGTKILRGSWHVDYLIPFLLVFGRFVSSSFHIFQTPLVFIFPSSSRYSFFSSPKTTLQHLLEGSLPLHSVHKPQPHCALITPIMFLS